MSPFGDKCPQTGSKKEPDYPKTKPGITLEGPSVGDLLEAVDRLLRADQSGIKSRFWKILLTFGDSGPPNGSKKEPISPKKNPGITLEGPSVEDLIEAVDCFLCADQTHDPRPPRAIEWEIRARSLSSSKVDGFVPRTQQVNLRIVGQPIQEQLPRPPKRGLAT